MELNSRIFVAGHRGLVGSALVRSLRGQGYENLLLRTREELDLTDAGATEQYFEAAKPEYVFMAAAKVGGIFANQTLPAEFIRNNLDIHTAIITAAHKHGVRRLLFLGSSCIYPKLAPQPLREDSLLSGPLEPTNRPYALAKIAGIEMCWSFNRQYGTRYLAAMPTNLYGVGDNFHPTHSHVVPALIRKFHEARAAGSDEVVVWGTGTPRREFMYSDDMADACVFLLNLPDERYDALLGSDEGVTGRFEPPIVNIGTGDDCTIAEVAESVARVVGYQGRIVFDTSKPDGPPRKLMDVTRLAQAGWRATTRLDDGLRMAYQAFLSRA